MDAETFLNTNAVYLCGPLEAVSVREGKSWRHKIGKRLVKRGFVILDPTEKVDKEVCEIGDEKKTLNKLKKDHDWKGFLDKMLPIVHYDLMCVDRASAVLCYINSPTVHMIGSTHELIVAKREKKKVYVVIDFDPAELNSWLLAIVRPNNIYTSFDEAINQLIKDFS